MPRDPGGYTQSNRLAQFYAAIWPLFTPGLTYFEALSEESEKDSFVNALLIRLNCRQEYYCVSYLTLYVLFRIGYLSDGLTAALQTLPERKTWFSRARERFTGPTLPEKHQQYGYSDFLGMINGLLRYEHREFSEQDIDEIDRFVSQSSEHPFRIPEKLNSIRSLRIAAQGSEAGS